MPSITNPAPESSSFRRVVHVFTSILYPGLLSLAGSYTSVPAGGSSPAPRLVTST